MDESLQKKILGNSAGWVAALLNFFPGLGTGYIYQRRWKAYWATTAISALWVFLGSYRDLSVDKSDPIQSSSDTSVFIGLFTIAAITAFEAWYTVKNINSQSKSL